MTKIDIVVIKSRGHRDFFKKRPVMNLDREEWGKLMMTIVYQKITVVISFVLIFRTHFNTGQNNNFHNTVFPTPYS